MDDRGRRWTVWEGNGNTPGLGGKGVSQREDGYPRRNDRAIALTGSAKSSIETWQPASRPVAGRPMNHGRLRDRFDTVTGTRPAGSSSPVNPTPGLWEVVGAAGFPGAVGIRAQSERASGRGGTFHSRRAFHCRRRIRVSATSSRRAEPRRRSRRPHKPASRAAEHRRRTRSWLASGQPPAKSNLRSSLRVSATASLSSSAMPAR